MISIVYYTENRPNKDKSEVDVADVACICMSWSLAQAQKDLRKPRGKIRNTPDP